MVKAVFIDIDGTLVNEKHEITNETKKVIKMYNKNNIYTIINSGRARKFTKEYALEANTSKYIVSSNGVDIYDIENKKSIYEDIIDKEDLSKIFDYILKNDLKVTINYEDVSLTNEITIYNSYAELKTNEELLDIIKDTNNNIVQLLITNKDINVMKEFKKYISSFSNLKIENQSRKLKDENEAESDLYYLDVIVKNNDKGTGMERICNYLGIDLKDTIAIGDSFNDVSMIEKAGIGVCMKNGQERLKKVSDIITKYTNVNDGCAKFLKNMLLNR